MESKKIVKDDLGVKIVVYTHTDYRRAWPIWFGQTQKFFPNSEKVIFANVQDENIPQDYKVIVYDDKDGYPDRVKSCLDKMKETDSIIFHHEDMFLYKPPNFTILAEFVKLLESNSELLIKLIKAGHCNIKHTIHDKLYCNPAGLNFSIQPTLCKVSLLKKIYSVNTGNTIWQFEQNAGNNLNTLYSLYCYGGEQLRGQMHYDSDIYPYVATAIVKGQWNLNEYGNELNGLFNEYKINNI